MTNARSSSRGPRVICHMMASADGCILMDGRCPTRGRATGGILVANKVRIEGEVQFVPDGKEE